MPRVERAALPDVGGPDAVDGIVEGVPLLLGGVTLDAALRPVKFALVLHKFDDRRGLGVRVTEGAARLNHTPGLAPDVPACAVGVGVVDAVSLHLHTIRQRSGKCLLQVAVHPGDGRLQAGVERLVIHPLNRRLRDNQAVALSLLVIDRIHSHPTIIVIGRVRQVKPAELAPDGARSVVQCGSRRWPRPRS